MGSRKYWIIGALLLFLAAGSSYWWWPRSGTAEAGPQELNKPATDFTLPDLKGKPFKLSSLRGKAVLLDFWATWCGPCIEDIPTLKALQRKFQAKGFTVLAVSLDDLSPKEVALFTKDHQVTYPVVMTGGQDKIPDGYNIFGLPVAYLISPAGVIVRQYFGPKDGGEVGRDIEATLKHAQS